MRLLLHYLVFFLTSLGLFPSGASAYSCLPHNALKVVEPNSVNSDIAAYRHSNGNQTFQCSLSIEAEHFDLSRFHLGLVDSLQRYGNFHWSLRPHSTTKPPPVRVLVRNFCDPGFKICERMEKELPEMVHSAIQDIHYWLYTSPYNGSVLWFYPEYPPVATIEILLGVGNFYGEMEGVSAYVPNYIFNDHTMKVFVNSRGFEVLGHTSPKWKVAKLARHVIMHEVVHTMQHGVVDTADGGLIRQVQDTILGCEGHPPGGLIEGIADFVPLKAGVSDPWWPKRPRHSSELPMKWDSGYLKTAYFLEWLEDVRIGHGAIGRLNDRIGKVGYFSKDESRFNACAHQPDTFKFLFGSYASELWDEYRHYVDGHDSYLHYVMNIFAHRATVSAIMGSIFATVFLSRLYEFAEETHLLDLALLGINLGFIYLAALLGFFYNMSIVRLWDLLCRIRLRDVCMVIAVASICILNCLLWVERQTPALEVSVLGCLWVMLMYVVHQFEEFEREPRIPTALDIRFPFVVQILDLAWDVEHKLLILAMGFYTLISMCSLLENGVPAWAVVIFGLFVTMHVLCVGIIVDVVKRFFKFIGRFLPGQDRRRRNRKRHP